MNDEKVSVIIPTYNREKTIYNSIESVLEQTYENLELLIIDDGSTDNTENVVKRINDSRIRYIKVKNGGANRARNIGIRLSSENSKLIAFNDSDDLWEKNKLETEVNVFKTESVDFVFSRYRLVRSNKVTVEPKYDQKNIRTTMLFKNFVNTPNLIVKKELIIKLGGFNEDLKRFQDWDLGIRLVNSGKYKFLSNILVISRQDGVSNLSINNGSANESLNYFEKEYDTLRNTSFLRSQFYFVRAIYAPKKEKIKFILRGFVSAPFNVVGLARAIRYF